MNCENCKLHDDFFGFCEKHGYDLDKCDNDFEDKFASMLPLEEVMKLLPKSIGCQFFVEKSFDSFSKPGKTCYRMGYATYRDDDDLVAITTHNRQETANELYNWLIEHGLVKEH